jgi:hypothetical protein
MSGACQVEIVPLRAVGVTTVKDAVTLYETYTQRIG